MANHIENCDHEFGSGPQITGVTKKCAICGRIEFLISKELLDEVHFIIVNPDGSREEIR